MHMQPGERVWRKLQCGFGLTNGDIYHNSGFLGLGDKEMKKRVDAAPF
jgi:hypothetical protein